MGWRPDRVCGRRFKPFECTCRREWWWPFRSARRVRARRCQDCGRDRRVRMPNPFSAVGMWYRDFSQTTDEEVRGLLDEHAQRIGRTNHPDRRRASLLRYGRSLRVQGPQTDDERERDRLRREAESIVAGLVLERAGDRHVIEPVERSPRLRRRADGHVLDQSKRLLKNRDALVERLEVVSFRMTDTAAVVS